MTPDLNMKECVQESNVQVLTNVYMSEGSLGKCLHETKVQIPYILKNCGKLFVLHVKWSQDLSLKNGFKLVKLFIGKMVKYHYLCIEGYNVVRPNTLF